MKPFLRQVVDHYLEIGGMQDKVFVFPNVRSMVFFKKHLKDAVRESGSSIPVVAPRMMAVNDFFSGMTGKKVADRISLLLTLYDCYSRLNKHAESLDDFVYWGDVILSDFNDVDKYEADAKGLFANIEDFKAIQDDFSYLTEEQRSAITRLAGHFTAGRVNPPAGKDVKVSFLQIWQLLHRLYTDFRQKLAAEGKAYEGMMYRELAARFSTTRAEEILKAAWPDAGGCVFIGLNALNKCEKDVLKALHNEGLAEFCWDWSGPMVQDKRNPSSLFMAQNVREYPNALTLDREGLPKPKIHVISVPSASGQAKLLPGILANVPKQESGLDFSVVLPDETMLLPVLSSLPESVPAVNVTMGYPLASSEWNSLMRNIAAMQLHLRSGKTFYHKQVHDILSNGIFKSLLLPEEAEAMAKVRQAAKSYIPCEDLCTSDFLTAVFRPVIRDMREASAEQVKLLGGYLMDVTFRMAQRMKPETDSLQMECAQQYWQCVNRLDGINHPKERLAVLPQTYFHLLEQLVSGISVPFAGEPLDGLQVMGPLEMRALDFKRVVILSANDSTFPRKSVRASFVPPEMRRAFGLPTYEYQDAVWAYYFYRMIARAEEVWMIYDSRTEGLNTGEVSRYARQLQIMFAEQCELDVSGVVADIDSSTVDGDIPKTEEDIDVIRNARFSASSVQKFIACQASFYYYVVKGLMKETEVSESLDAGMLGTVCHDTLQAFYAGEKAMKNTQASFDKRRQGKNREHMDIVPREYLEDWLKREPEIREKVLSLIREQVKSPVVEGRDLVAAEIAVRFVKEVIRQDLRQLGDRKYFRIIDVERPCNGEICGHKFTGFIDRLDSFDDGVLRVVDYKTGSDRQAVLDPGDDPQKVADNAFGTSNAHAYKAALQFFIYDRFVQMDASLAGRFHTVKNVMYSMSDIFSSDVKTYPVDGAVMDGMESKLEEVFASMEDPARAFSRVDPSGGACDYCDYRILCGRTSRK